jgi:hypothetical protein
LIAEVKDVELVPVRDHIVEAFDNQLQIRTQRLQFLVPEEVVVPWSAF